MKTFLVWLIAAALVVAVSGVLALALERTGRDATERALLADLEARELEAHRQLVEAELALMDATAETLASAKAQASQNRGAWIALEDALASARKIAK